jgi:EAL domain-containing protein (putative c-di-GMP-specific phosphodiesterase class I)/CheY-like chemotaxis protein
VTESAQPQPVRLVVAEDDASVRDVLVEYLGADASLELVGVATTGEEAVAVCARLKPDVALMDVRMPGGGGIRAVTELRQRAPGTRVLVLSAYSDRGAVTEMLRAGAVGYLVKGTSIAEIRAAIERAANDEPSLSQDVAPIVVEELRNQLVRDGRRREEQRRRVERIERVLGGEDLTIAFQPIVDVASRRPVGFEALARFGGDPPRPPDVWFADAEAVGLGVELELAALRAALAAAERLPASAFVAINIGPAAAESDELAHHLGGVERRRRTVLEITEHAPIADYDALASRLEPLRASGVRLAIDDAGAGFASLRHIVLLRPDFIKLDVSLTRDIDSDVARRALARGLTSFGTEIGTTIVGEGVETASELRTLQELGVRTAQGYFLGRPAPID